MANMPRKLGHFDDPKLERQIEEIIRFEQEINREVIRNSKRVENIEEPRDPSKRPNAPKELEVSGAFKKFFVRWRQFSGSYISHYVLSYSESADEQNTWSEWININAGNTGMFVHENLDFDKDYRYRVAAVNKNGIYSKWSNIVIAGKPGKVSLASEVIDNLDYENLDPQMKEAIEQVVAELDPEDAGTISAWVQAADEISSAVRTLMPESLNYESVIQQQAEFINFRVQTLDEENNPVVVNAQIEINADGYIILDADTVLMSGDAIIDGSIKASKYEQLRSVDTQNFLDSLDNNNPIIYDFYIPSETFSIISVKLSAKGLPFRAYSKAAQSSDLGTKTAQDSGQHKHDLEAKSLPNLEFTKLTDLGHQHWYYNHEGEFKTHAVSMDESELSLNHRHAYDALDVTDESSGHEHDVPMGTHDHNIVYGIFEDTLPTNVILEIDNGTGFNQSINLGDPDGDGILADELDLTVEAEITGTGWKRLRFKSDSLGRINANIVIKSDIDAIPGE